MDLLEQSWGKVSSSLLFRVPAVRVDLHHARGRVLQARAAEQRRKTGDAGDSAEVKRLLGEAEACARCLDREPAPAARAWARLLRAGAATIRGEREQGIALLRDAVAACDRLEMASYATCARLVLGRVLGGVDGETMHAEAALWLQEQGVRNPSAMAALHVPIYFDGKV